jgi:hypothetical protein
MLSTIITHVTNSYHAASDRFGPSVPKEISALHLYHLTSFHALVLINILYLIIIFSLKFIMQNLVDDGLELKSYRIIYNASCVALSCLTAYMLAGGAYREGFTVVCSNDFPGRVYPSFQTGVYLFYLSKFWEFQDTIIMVLRKKFNQLSFLHVYHHTSITLVVWCYLRFSGGGDEWVPGFLNSMVHVLMYTHYLAATLGYSTWWKSQLTTLQITQFVLIFLQSVVGLWLHCGWADFLNVMQLFYMVTMFVLFTDFYIRSYKSNQLKKNNKSTSNGNNNSNKDD